jgi:hypothetical protein
MKKDVWERIGVVGVDSGTIVIHDPCYSEGISDLPFPEKPAQVLFDNGATGRAVHLVSGLGDWIYPVFVRRTAEGDIAEVRVLFINDDGMLAS